MTKIDDMNGIETPVPENMEQALRIIAELKAKLASYKTDDSRYNRARMEGYNEGYRDGKDFAKHPF